MSKSDKTDKTDKFDVIVIGSGPGGYVGAIRAAQLGLKTAIVEKRATLGGTCLNVGCIPSKALLDSSEQYHLAKEGGLDVHGISVGNVKIDVSKMIDRKQKVVDEVCQGVDFLMKKNKITRLEGFGRLIGDKKVEILPVGKNGLEPASDEPTQTVEADHIILATGSEPIELPGFEFDEKSILSSTGALELTKVPKHLLIIGAGVIGLELGSVWKRLGAKVTVLEMMPGLLPGIDKQMAGQLQRSLEGQGLEFLFGVKVTGYQKKGGDLVLEYETKDGKKESLKGDKILAAVGRRPFTDHLGLEKAGVELTERGRIKVDPANFQTSAPGVYAIGDVIDGPMLAHKAEDEGIALAEMLAGQAGHINYEAIPWIIYTWPEMAWVGRGEDQLKADGVPYKTGRSIFRSNGRAKAMNETEGQVKILTHKETDRVLGLFIFGPRASDMIVEAAVAMEFGASAEDLARVCHAHPTLSEVVREAAMAAGGWSIHS